MMTEARAKELLAAHGVPIPEARDVSDVDRAVSAAEVLGFPVVLKVAHPDLAHKTDIDGVVLDVADSDTVREEAARLLGFRTGAKVLVERQAPEGIADLILGFTRDPAFGTVLLLGMGGIHAEFFNDRVFHIGEPATNDALEMLGRLQGKALLEGARGRPAAALEPIADAIVALGRLAAERPDIAEFDINPLRVHRDRVLALDALAVPGGPPPQPERLPSVDVRPFFAPDRVAVVGASTSATKAGNVIIRNMKTLGFKGAIYPVNPTGGQIEGLTSYPTLDACPETPDLAVIAVPNDRVEPILRTAAESGTGHAIIVTGGFSDGGPEGRIMEERLVELSRETGLRFMGPNSIGTIDTAAGFSTAIGLLLPLTSSGISLVGQTGTLSTSFTLEAQSRHHRSFARVACLGNKANVTDLDFLTGLSEHEATKVVGLYLESVTEGRRFMEIAAATSLRKPVVVLKSGRSEAGAAAAASHTGAMAGSDAVFDAACRQAGVHRVDDFADFFEVLRCFDLCPLPKGPRVGVVSVTGMGCVLAADACDEFGLEIAPISEDTRRALVELAPGWASIGNPADIWSTIEKRGPHEAFRSISEVMIRDPNVDMLLLIGVLIEEGSFDVGSALRDACNTAPNKPILTTCLGARRDLLEAWHKSLADAGLPACHTPRSALQAARILLDRHQITTSKNQQS